MRPLLNCNQIFTLTAVGSREAIFTHAHVMIDAVDTLTAVLARPVVAVVDNWLNLKTSSYRKILIYTNDFECKHNM